MTDAKKIHIGFVLFDTKHSYFWSLTANCLQTEAAERGFQFTTVAVKTVAEQARKMHDLLDAGVDAFLIKPMAFDDPALIAIVTQAVAAHVPVILLDSTLATDLPLTTVGTDNASGQAAVTEMIFKQLGGRGKVAYFQGDKRIGAGAARTNSFHALLPHYPDIEVVYEAMLDWRGTHSRPKEGADRMREALAACPDLQAVICSHDESALGAMDVIDETGRRGQILVGGFDGIPEALMAVHDGRMLVTAQQVSRAIAWDALDTVVSAVYGEPIARTVRTPVNLVTSENVIDATIESMQMIPGMIRGLVDSSEIQRKLQQEVIVAQHNILQTMAAVSQAVAGILDPDQMMVKVVELLRKRFNLYSTAVYLTDRTSSPGAENQHFTLRAVSVEENNLAGQADRPVVPLEEALVRACLRQKQVRVATGKTARPEFGIDLPPWVQVQAACPLTIGDQVIGVLAVQSAQGKTFDDDAVMVLQTISDQVAVAIKSASLYVEQKNASAFLDTVLDNIPTSLHVKDAENFRYLLWNKAGEKLHNDTREDRLGKTVYDLYSKEVADDFMQRDIDIIKKGVLCDIPEETVQTRYNGERTLHTKKIPIFRDDGRVKFLISISEDITESKKTEIALATRARELEAAYLALKENQEKLLIAEKMASIGRLTAGIAHEMNTPLAAVRASMSELRSLVKEYEEAIDDPAVNGNDHREIVNEMEQAIQLATTSAERAAGFVRGVKSQTRDLSSQQVVWFNAVQTIDEAILLLSHVLRDAKCTVTFDRSGDVMELYGSPGRLAQVVTNLVVNAADASADSGGGAIRLHLAPTSDDYLLLTVSDTGSGIDPDIITRIFEPMFTTKPFGQGTGLGLSIVHDIVTSDFSGKLDVSSKLGEGTTFSAQFAVPKKEKEVRHGA